MVVTCCVETVRGFCTLPVGEMPRRLWPLTDLVSLVAVLEVMVLERLKNQAVSLLMAWPRGSHAAPCTAGFAVPLQVLPRRMGVLLATLRPP